MKKTIYLLATFFIFIVTARAQQASNLPADGVLNRVLLPNPATIKDGQPIFLKTRNNSYRRALIQQTWKDNSKLRKLEVRVLSKEPLSKNVYHIAELGFTTNIQSELFNVGEHVYFKIPSYTGEIYLKGIVAGIYANGDIIVQNEHEYYRIKAGNLFSAEKNYKLTDLKPNEQIVLDSYSAHVLGISPAGDILISMDSTGKIQKISIQSKFNVLISSTLQTSNPISPAICSLLFN